MHVASRQAAKDARAQLAAVGLPGSIAAQDDGRGFPEAVWQRVAAVQAGGGGWALAQQVAELDRGAQRAADLLDQTAAKLAEEDSAHATFVRQRGAEAVASLGGDVSASRGFSGDVAHYGELLRRAQASDAALKALVSSATFQNDVAKLGKTRQQLDGLLPRYCLNVCRLCNPLPFSSRARW